MRILFAIIVLLVLSNGIGFYLGMLPSVAASEAYVSLQFNTASLGLFAAGCAGFIARRHFVLAAVAVYAVFWLLAMRKLHEFSHALSQGLTYADIISLNILPICLSITSAGIGAFLGQYLARIQVARAKAA